MSKLYADLGEDCGGVMKRFLGFAIILFFAINICACSQNENLREESTSISLALLLGLAYMLWKKIISILRRVVLYYQLR